MWAERAPSPRPISGERSPSSDSWGPRIPSRVSAAPGEANSEDGGVWGAKGTAPDGAGFTLARPSLSGFAGALPDSGSSPGSLGDTGEGERRKDTSREGGGGPGGDGTPRKGRAPGETRGAERGSLTSSPGPRVPARRFRRSPGPPRRGLATSSSDVSRRRHIGKAPPPPPPPLPPPPPPPPRSSGSPWAATAGRKEPLARPDDRPACFAPARLPMTAPGPATDGRRPSTRV